MQLIESEKLGAREVPSVVRTPSAGEKKEVVLILQIFKKRETNYFPAEFLNYASYLFSIPFY